MSRLVLISRPIALRAIWYGSQRGAKSCFSITYFSSLLAHFEPELEMFEVDDIGNDGDGDLSYHYLPNFKQL